MRSRAVFALAAMLMLSPCLAAEPDAEAEAVRKAFAAGRALAGEWKVVAVKTRKPLTMGRRLPESGDKIKFDGTPFLATLG